MDIVTKNKRGDVFTTSLLIAEKFHKRHKTIIRKIENLPDDEFGRRNFVPSSYVNSQNKTQPMYEITRDGFTILAMGLTGPEAYKWKVKFLDAFNKMERHLRNLLKNEWIEHRAEAALEYKTMSRTLEKSGD